MLIQGLRKSKPRLSPKGALGQTYSASGVHGHALVGA